MDDKTVANAEITNGADGVTVTNQNSSMHKLAMRRNNEEAIEVEVGGSATVPLKTGEVLIVAAVVEGSNPVAESNLSDHDVAAMTASERNNPDPDAVAAGAASDAAMKQADAERQKVQTEKQIEEASRLAQAQAAQAQATAPADVTNPLIGTSTETPAGSPAPADNSGKTEDEILAELMAEEAGVAAANGTPAEAIGSETAPAPQPEPAPQAEPQPEPQPEPQAEPQPEPAAEPAPAEETAAGEEEAPQLFEKADADPATADLGALMAEGKLIEGEVYVVDGVKFVAHPAPENADKLALLPLEQLTLDELVELVENGAITQEDADKALEAQTAPAAQ